MGHTLKKYLSNRGSALFMVLSTMTALMICCMAMYFSIISSRSTQYAIFNQQQAYQSAVSLSDAMIAELVGNSSSDFGKLKELMNGMENEGDVVTTNANGFLAFGDEEGKKDDEQVGAYMLTITRLDDETRGDGTKVKMFDIVVTTSVKGTKEILHNIIQFEGGGEPVTSPTKPFTATGYTPNDVFIDGGTIKAGTFFDNEQTFFKAYTSTNLNFTGDVNCGGSLYVNSQFEITKDFPLIFAIRGNYINKDMSGSRGEISLPAGSTVMIGGDCEGYFHFGNSNIYILGDLILDYSGNDWRTWSTLSSSSHYFVAGDIIIKDEGHKKDNYSWLSLSKVYCNGSVIRNEDSPVRISSELAGTWDAANVAGAMKKDEMVKRLDLRTATGKYYKWRVDTSKINGGTKKIEFDPDKGQNTRYIGYGVDGTGCTIEDITMKYTDGAQHSLTLVIDTGEDPENVYTIDLKGNRDWLKGDVKNETFCWYPANTSGAMGGTNGDVPVEDTFLDTLSRVSFQVLVMGRGSVLFNVPDGIIYQDDDQMKVMHYGWYVLGGYTETYHGGDKKTMSKKDIIENTDFSHALGGSDAVIYPQYIHTGCHEGDGCKYTETATTENCKKCGKPNYQVKCDTHGALDSYCKDCEAIKRKDINCDYHVHRPQVDTYLASNSDAKSRMMDSKNQVIYPNVNIFVISCDENANFRFATAAAEDATKTPKNFTQNCLFGYIYAPYMTFKAVLQGTSSGASYTRLVGGMTVSDYIIDDSYTILAVLPDKLPQELMGSENINEENELSGADSKSWKISLVGR